MPERVISLRFAAWCRRCGREIAAGESARWNANTKWTACVRCPRAPASPRAHAAVPQASVAERSTHGIAAPPAERARDRWQTVIDYHLAAVRREAAPTPPLVGDRDRWTLLPITREDVITGRGDALHLPPEGRHMAASTQGDDVVHYGWPLVVVEDRAGAVRLAPLFITELETAVGSDQAVPRDDEPYLNPSLLSEEFFAPEGIAAAQSAIESGTGFGDAAAVARAAQRVADALGLPAPTALDADALHRPPGPDVGVHNVAVLVRGPSTLATRALVEELEELRTRTDWTGTAAAWLTRSVDDPPSPVTDPRVPTDGPPTTALAPAAFDGLALNDSQEQAVTAALSRPLTVVTGPPGTGKSQLVASIVANQWLAGRSILLASTNNGAVDVAVQRCARLDPALLLRTGNRDVRDRLPEQLEELAARGQQPGPSEQVIRRQLETAAAGRAEVLNRLESRTRHEAELAQNLIDVELLRARLWGEDARGTSHADAAETDRWARKAARSRWFRGRRHRRALAAARPTMPGVTADDVAQWAATERAVIRLRAVLTEAGPADADADRRALHDADAAWAAAGTVALRDVVQRRLHAGAAALQHLARLRTAARDARTRAVARALPTVGAWACTALSVRHTFPLSAGLFDLLVIDEASQCSIAHVLPLAYRARRIVVVGDPNQLTPVVTLDRRSQARLAASVGWTAEEARRQALSVGHDSAFTAYAARGPGQPLLLAEHYRCHPSIARFFNEHFYGGLLRLLTDVAHGGDGARGLHLLDVRGTTERAARGGAVNAAEADAVVRWIAEHSGGEGTIGVVTPFAAQAALIERRLRATLGPDAAARIRVGTAHRFQGDECDVVLFSAVLSAGVGAGTARWVEEQRNLVNVAVSRARRALVVVADAAAVTTVPVPTLQALVAMAADGGSAVDAADALRESRGLHSEGERRLFEALVQAGLPPRVKVVVEGYELDLVLDAGAPIDVEVDGIHHSDARGRQRRQDLARDAVLESLGWRVVRVPTWRALAEADEVAAELAHLPGR